MDTIQSALGLKKQLVLEDPPPALVVLPAAQARMDAQPEGHGIHIDLLPDGDGGYDLDVTEGPAEGPSPEGYRGFTAGRAALKRLKGMKLDWREGWVLTTHVEIHASETPNPNGRMYKVNRVLARGGTHFFDEPVSTPALARDLLGVPNVLTALVRHNTVTVEREVDASWDAIDRGVADAIRDHLLSCAGPLEPEAAANRGDLEARVQKVVEAQILPGIHRDGGHLEIVSIDAGIVKVEMTGACRSCPASMLTLKAGVERTLKGAFPGEIERVEPVERPAE